MTYAVDGVDTLSEVNAFDATLADSTVVERIERRLPDDDPASVLFLREDTVEGGPSLNVVHFDPEGEGDTVSVTVSGLPDDGRWRRVLGVESDTRVEPEASATDDDRGDSTRVRWNLARGGKTVSTFDGDIVGPVGLGIELDGASDRSWFVASDSGDDLDVEPAETELHISSSTPETVSATLSSLSFIPGKGENAIRGGDPLNSGLPQILPETIDIQFEIKEIDQGIVDEEVDVYPMFDNWTTGNGIWPNDGSGGLPDTLGGPDTSGTALYEKSNKYEELPDDYEISNYKQRNEISLSFSVDDGSITDLSFDDTVLNAAPSVYEQEDINNVPREWLDFTELDGRSSDLPPDKASKEYLLDSSEKQHHYDYDVVEVDGTEAVRVSFVGGTYTQVGSKVTEQINDRPVQAPIELYGLPNYFEDLKFIDSILSEYVPFLDLLTTTPNIHNFFEMLVFADGRKMIRVWDHSMFPQHEVYLGENRETARKRFRSELETQPEGEEFNINYYFALFFAEAVVNHSPYYGPKKQYIENIRNEPPYDKIYDVIWELVQTFKRVQRPITSEDYNYNEFASEVLEVITHDHPVAHFGVDADGNDLDPNEVASKWDQLQPDLLNPFNNNDYLIRHTETWTVTQLDGFDLRHEERWPETPLDGVELRHEEQWPETPLDGIDLRHEEQWPETPLGSVELVHRETWPQNSLERLELRHEERWSETGIGNVVLIHEEIWQYAPTARIDAPETVAVGEEVELDASASSDPDEPIAGYEWELETDDGATSGSGPMVSQTWTAPGSYDVTVTATDQRGATDTTTVTVTVEERNRTPEATIDSPEATTVEEAVTLEAGASSDPDGEIAGYEWTIETGAGDRSDAGATVDQTWTEPGEYLIELTVTDDDGATDSTDTSVSVEEPNAEPEPAISTPENPVAGERVEISAADATDPDGEITDYEWTFETDGGSTSKSGTRVQMAWGTPGSYAVELTITDDDGASATTTATVTVVEPNDGPTAVARVPDRTTVGEPITLDGTESTDPDGQITTYGWTVEKDGGEASLSGENPTFDWSTPGTYQVQLRVADDDGATDTDDVSVAVREPNEKPTATVDVDEEVTAGTAVDLVGDGSSDPDGTIRSHEWTIQTATGTVSRSGARTQYEWTATGTFDVELTVTDDDGATDTSPTTVTVVEPNTDPNAGISIPGNPVAGTAVSLDGSESSDPDGTVETYEWTIEGASGTESRSGATVDKTWVEAGTYDVGLRVTDDDGATAETTRTVTVQQPNTDPAAVVDVPDTVSVDETVTIDGSGSSDPDGTIEEYAWSIETAADPVERSGATVERSWSEPGAYAVELTVTDDRGAVASTSAVVDVAEPNQPPVAGIDLPDEIVVGEEATLDGSGSNDPDGDIETYEWTVERSDGAVTATGRTASITWRDPGDYSVELTVTDDAGATDTASRTVSVAAQTDGPEAAVSTSGDPTVGSAVTLDASSSSDPDGSLVEYRWSIQTGSDTRTVSGRTVEQRWSEPGSYTVAVTVTDDDGATDEASTTVTVEASNQAPTAELSAPGETTAGTTVTLDGGGSSDSDGSVASYEWIIQTPDGERTASGRSVPQTWNQGGDYGVELTVTDDDGATDTTSTSVSVVDPDPVTASLDVPYLVFSGSTATLSATGSSGPVERYTWEIERVEGTEMKYGESVDVSWPEGGSYEVTLTVTGPNGQADSASDSVYVWGF